MAAAVYSGEGYIRDEEGKVFLWAACFILPPQLRAAALQNTTTTTLQHQRRASFTIQASSLAATGLYLSLSSSRPRQSCIHN